MRMGRCANQQDVQGKGAHGLAYFPRRLPDQLLRGTSHRGP